MHRASDGTCLYWVELSVSFPFPPRTPHAWAPSTAVFGRLQGGDGDDLQAWAFSIGGTLLATGRANEVMAARRVVHVSLYIYIAVI